MNRQFRYDHVAEDERLAATLLTELAELIGDPQRRRNFVAACEHVTTLLGASDGGGP